MKKTTVLLTFVLLFTIVLSSCGARGYESSDNAAYDSGSQYPTDDYYYVESDASYDKNYGLYDKAEAEYPSATEATGSQSITDTRKIIRTETLKLETKTFDQAVTDITEAVERLGGYIENSYVSGRSLDAYNTARYATFTLRVPAEALTEYVGYIETSYHVTSRNTNASDITDSYYDIQSKLNSLLTQEERLLAMLEGAKDLEYMLQVEDKLANVRYQIENYYSILSRYDKQVSLSTVNITLNEVIEYRTVTELPKSFGERVATALNRSWENFVDDVEDFVIDFMYSLPGLICFAVFVLIVVIIIMILVRRRKNRKQKRLQSADDNPDKHTDNTDQV